MMNALQLLMPVLFPSWRFFPEVGPSPRIEYMLLSRADDKQSAWAQFCPHPESLSFFQSAKGLLWNPERNRALFLVTCSEQFLANDSKPALEHLVALVRAGLMNENAVEHDYFQFRLMVIFREGDELEREEVYRSSVMPLKEGAIT